MIIISKRIFIGLMTKSSKICKTCNSGSVVLLFALMAPVLIAAVGAAIDYGIWVKQRSQLQAAADVAAMASARELTVSSFDAKRIQFVAESWAKSAYINASENQEIIVKTFSADEGKSVRVELSQSRKVYFSGILNSSPGPLEVSAVATLNGRKKICVVALDNASSSTISLKSNSWLTALGCDVQSNSVSSSGVTSDSSIQVTAERTCSSGGFFGQGSFYGLRVDGCKSVDDPLVDRAPPTVGGCTANNRSITDQGTASSPYIIPAGVYCGGLMIGGNANVRFAPGEYVIKDGPLVIDSNANAQGDGVGFYLVGNNSTFRFMSNARVSLKAPVDGALAGLLFFEDRAAPLLRNHEIKTNYVSNMTGTIYLPRGRFVVDATNEIAQQSAFTVIVVRQLLMTSNPKLIVNTNYGGTPVPVPLGLGQIGGDVRILR